MLEIARIYGEKWDANATRTAGYACRKDRQFAVLLKQAYQRDRTARFRSGRVAGFTCDACCASGPS